jgi:hypothetical protein
MKEIICSFIIALVLSCLLNSLGYMLAGEQMQPSPWPVGVTNVQESKIGLKRDEENIGEVQYVDGARPVTIITGVEHNSNQRNGDMPLGANN